MLKIGFLFASTVTLVVHAASLQNPTYSTAYYNAIYVGNSDQLNSINNNGVAVGEHLGGSSRTDPSYDLVYTPNRIQEIYVPFQQSFTGSGAKLTGINDSGTYVGYGSSLNPPYLSQGFIGSSASISSPVAILNIPGAVGTFPYAINNAGIVVGGYISPVDGREHGFIYRSGGTIQTLDNPGFSSTTLTGINNLGQIVGTTGLNINDIFPPTGFLYSGGTFVELNYGHPAGINDSGAIAITLNSSPNSDGGVLYPDGTLATALVSGPYPSSSPVPFNGLSAINNQGTLIFNSGYAFIATPVAPEPTPVALIAVGAFALATVRFRRRPRTGILKRS